MNAELTFRSCDTNVGSLGIQLPITMRPPGFRDANHLLGYVKGLGCEHRAEHREGQIKCMVAHTLQVARISFLKFQAARGRPPQLVCSRLPRGFWQYRFQLLQPLKG